MAVAIVTGASSGLGLEISKMLVRERYTVRALARDFSRTDFANERFLPMSCDVSDLKSLQATFDEIVAGEKTVDVLVNNAGIGHFGPHETLSAASIAKMVQTNLTAPMVLTHLALRRLQQSRGFVINIASTAALYPHRFGCAYAAAKAGLYQFGESLFDEVRKVGVKVCTICPDMVEGTEFYDEASFETDADPDCHLAPADVAEVVRGILTARKGTVQTLVVLKPQRVGIARKKGH